MLFILSAVRLHAQADYSEAYAITTFAGAGPPSGNMDGTGVDASFNTPCDVAVDVAGNTYVADRGNHSIRKITPGGVVTTLAGSASPGATDGLGVAARFNSPEAIAIDVNGNLYVGDTGNRKIRKITPEGMVTTFSGSGNLESVDGNAASAGFVAIRGVAVADSGIVYVSEGSKIRKITADGTVTTLVQGGGFSGYLFGRGIAVDKIGNVYASQESTIFKISPAGAVTTFISTSPFQPWGLAVDDSGNCYVSDTSSHKLYRITPSGVMNFMAGAGAADSDDGMGAAASFDLPIGVAVDRDGTVYVADRNNHKIRKVTSGGLVTTLAGAGAGSANGTGAAARFRNPNGVALDGGGNLYVADTLNHIIRKITPAGEVTRLAGVPRVSGSTEGSVATARFNSPEAVAVDAVGNVYVADTSNRKIRKISTLGVVSTLAGSGNAGSLNGTGVAASFYAPRGLAVDGGGNVYVVDANLVRRITSTGVVTTLAGSSTMASVDGTGTSASFYNPFGIAIDGTGNLYVAEPTGHKIRKVTPSGTVTTLAGSGIQGSADGTGVIAGFSGPRGIAADYQGNVYVADTQNQLIRKISPGGVVKTLAGMRDATGLANERGSVARFNNPTGIAVGVDDTIYVADLNNNVIRKGTPLQQQSISFPAIPGKIFGDPPFGLSSTASSGLPVTFSIVSGPATLSGSTITITGAGTVVVRASQVGNMSYSAATSIDQTFTVARAPQSISFAGLQDRVYSPSPFTITASASSGLVPTYSVVSGPATVSGAQVTLTGAGTVVIRASQTGNSNYLAASTVDRSFNVSKISQTISLAGATSITLPFTTQVIPINATASSGLPVSVTVASGPGTVSGNSLRLSSAGTVMVRVGQVGNAFYSSAPDAFITFTVTANTSGPTSIALSKLHFYDNLASGSEIGVLSAIDPDTGDTLSYSLVAGAGGADNAKFSIAGDRLRTTTTFNHQVQREVSIRVRATDSASQSYEQIFIIKVLPASPNARFIHAGIPFTQAPNYVNAVFQLVGKTTGRGLNYPRSLFDTASPDYQPDLFQVFEGASLSSATSPIAFNESYFQVGKISDVPSKVRTVLLIDCSSSISIADLAVIKNAAKVMVDSMFDEQEIAVYSFSGSHTLVHDFLGKSEANQQALKTAIDTISRGSATTNLYGSMVEMLKLEAWKESFSTAGIETGFLVVLTDGADSSGSATKEQVLAERNARMKRIYTIGLGAAIEPLVLQELQNTLYIPVTQAAGLASAFDDIQKDIIDLANSYYRINYISPKRASNPLGQLRKLEVRLKNNTNSAADGVLSTSFNSDTFTDLLPSIYINRSVDRVNGIESLSIRKDAATTASAITLFPPLDYSSFTWTIGNPALATLTPQGNVGQRVIITPNGQDGTTTLTLTDTISNFTKTIPLIIGTGTSLPPQTISFDFIADRVPDSPAFELSASASSGLPVVFTVVSGPAWVSGNTVTLAGSPGIVTILATQPGNAVYASAVPVERSFTLAAARVLVTDWISDAGLVGPDAGVLSTPHSDGVPNLIKFAFNMNAARADVSVLSAGATAGLPSVELASSASEPVLKVTYLRRKGSGLIYTPQWSDTLTGFSPIGATPIVTSIDGLWERVVVERPIPNGSNSKGFVRVLVGVP